METSAADIPFIIEQVTTCLRLADECTDREISQHLIKLAEALVQRALHLGARPDLLPDIPINDYHPA
jgi:hypothetical protein